MKLKTNYSLTTLIISILFTFNLNAQIVWQQTRGPYGGTIFSFAINSNGDIYVGTDGGGIFRSMDNGNTWSPINNGLTSYVVRTLAINSNGDIFVGTVGAGIFRSTDNGNNWSQINNGLTSYVVRTLAINSNGVIFVSTDFDGIYRSTDNGNNWIQIMPNTLIYDFAINSNSDIYAGSPGEGIYRSTDNGNNWIQINNGLSNKNVRTLAINSNGDIFAGTWMGGIFRSTANGNNWTQINNGLTNTLIFALAINSNGDIFAGTWMGGIFRSTDNGNNWVQINNGLTNKNVWSLAINSSDDIFTSTHDGIFRSMDYGNNWIQTNSGLTSTIVNALTISSSGDIFAGTNGGGIFRSTDNGNNWTQINNGLTNYSVKTLTINSNGDIFAGTNGGGIFRSTDNGNNWTLINTGLTNLYVFALTSNPVGDIFAGTNGGGIFRSTDNGNNWTQINIGLTHLYVLTLIINPVGDIFAGTKGGGIFRSTDNGNNWTQINTGLTNTIIWALTINPVGDIFAGTNGRGIFRSTDNGNNWTQINIGLPNLYVFALTSNPVGDIFVGTRGSGVFKSLNTNVISVLSPNGGEILYADGSYNIQYFLPVAIPIQVEYSFDNGFYWNVLDIINSPAFGINTYSWNPLPSTLSNYCFIRISDLNDLSIFDINDNTFSIIAITLVPNAPNNLVATINNQNNIDLQWNDKSNDEDGFKVFRKEGSGNYQEITSLGINIQNYHDQAVLPNRTYYYRIIAYNTSGKSVYSNTAVASTGNVPNAPLNLQTRVYSTSRIRLDWQETSDNEDGFKIERKTTGSWDEIRTINSNRIYWIDSHLSSGITYTYRIRAFNLLGNSPYSNESASTMGGVPNKPVDLVASSNTTNSVQLNWNDNSNDETGFVIYRKAGNQWIEIDQVNANITSYLDTGLGAGQTFYYKITAKNNYGESQYSNIAQNTLGSIPNKPSNLSGNVNQNQVELTWNDNSNNANEIRIEREDNNSGDWDPKGTVSPGVEYYQENVSSNTNYAYRVRAINNFGPSAASNTIFLTTNTTTFSADIRTYTLDGNLGYVDVFIDRGNGLNYEGMTLSNGIMQNVQNLKIGDKIFATKMVDVKQAVKDGHDLVDGLMFELHLDSRYIQPNGSYQDIQINAQNSQYNIFMGHPIFKYNLVVSLEWSATIGYLELLKLGLNRASKELFNTTDGQVMFNKIAIYNAESHWNQCDIRIFDELAINDPHEAPPLGIERSNDWMLPNRMKLYRTHRKLGNFPNMEKYYKSIVHEFGHYGFGLYDEYKNGAGNYEEFIEYRTYNFMEFPPLHTGYGLMENESVYIEMSSHNDYLEYYPSLSWFERETITMQLWQREMPSWTWIEKLLEDYGEEILGSRRIVDIITPEYAYLRNGNPYPSDTDRKYNTEEQHNIQFVSSAYYNTNPIFVVPEIENSNKYSFNINIQPTVDLDLAEVYHKTNKKINYLGRILPIEGMEITSLENDGEFIIIKNQKGKSSLLKKDISNVKNEDVSSFRIKKYKSTLADTIVPGVISEFKISDLSTNNILIDIFLSVDEPLDSLPIINYYVRSDSGTVNVIDIGNNSFIGTFPIEPSLPEFDGSGYIEISLEDTSANINYFINDFQIHQLSVSESSDLQRQGMNLVINKESINNDQYVIINSYNTLPYKTFSQNLYQVSRIYSFNLTEDAQFNSESAINIYYGEYDVQNYNESSIKLYKFNPIEKIWEVMTDSNSDIKENVVSSLINEHGIYCLFATIISTDIIPPSTTTDLFAFTGDSYGEISIIWSAAGDDDTLGRASYYDLRWSYNEINAANWDSSKSLHYYFQPNYFTDQEVASFKFNEIDSTYYFALKTTDESSNTSLISNSTSSTPSTYSLNVFSIQIQNLDFSRAVFLGKNENATLNYDPNLDLEATLPDSGFYAYLLTQDQYELTTDFRSITDTTITWELHIQSTLGVSDTIEMSWDNISLPNDGEYLINGIDMRNENKLSIVGDNIVNINFNRYSIPAHIIDQNKVITTFELYQNYPNPFNPTTLINYQIPKPANVKIEIFNILGQKVKVLVNSNQKQGLYSVQWNGQNNLGLNVASGVYIYKITAGKFIKSKKMVLIR